MAEYKDIQQGQFYYHFKRESYKGVEHGAYYILGLGMDTEDRSQHYVICKPLYFCDPRKQDETGISYQVRPVEYFVGEVDRENYKGERFRLIEDQDIIDHLKKVELFGSEFLDS